MTFDTYLLICGLALLGYSLGSAIRDTYQCKRCGRVFQGQGRPVAYAWPDARYISEVEYVYLDLCDPCYLEVRGQDDTEVES